ILFSSFPVAHQVFHTSPSGLSHALNNLRPLLPGHTLVIPHRTSARHLEDLSEEERADMLATVVRVQKVLRRVYSPAGKVTAFNVAIQDGVAAGQTVPHLHIHVIPRRDGDLEPYGGGDVLYEWLESEEGDLNQQYEAAGKGARDNEEKASQRRTGSFTPEAHRKNRSTADMRAEAEWLAREMAREEE
ncbi:HIT-like protein, partial [Viridothelium virens]